MREQARELAQQFPALLEEAEGLIEPIRGFFGLGIGPEPEELLGAAWDSVSQGRALEAAAGVGTTVVTAVSLGIVVLLAALYLVARPRPWVNGFVSLFPANRRQRVREVLKKLHHMIQRWILGQLVAMAFIGVSSAVALTSSGCLSRCCWGSSLVCSLSSRTWGRSSGASRRYFWPSFPTRYWRCG